LANEITFTVKLDDKGSLALVTKQAKKTADSLGKVEAATKKANKSQDHFARGAKGVGQAGLSASKGFSKMRDSMSGSNGLVSAYAILAANIFAATAAFNALRRAAQVEQLEKGLRLVGAAAGQNLPDVAKRLREITGEAVSAEQSMRATALAMSAGFRSDQLVNLAKVAKGASIALGRDMGDALDRLVRGAAKLEPEILDELGIMVRLDKAVQDYADKLNIAKESLTQFDRRQAFANAILDQGLEKYEDLSKMIDSNPYDKLAASLANLQKNFINTTAAVTGLATGVEFASKNLASLAAVATTLAVGITKGVAPGLFRMADSAAATASGALAAQTAVAGLATEGVKLPPKFAKLAGALQNGTATSEQFATANLSLQGQLGGLTGGLKSLTKGTEEYAAKADEIQGVRNQMTELGKLENLQANARVTGARATAIGSAANFNLRDSFTNLKTSFKEDKLNTDNAIKGKKGLKVSMTALGPAFRVAGTGAKAFGAALFTALPYIGLIITVVSTLYGVIKEKFFPEDIVQKRIDDAIDSFKQFSEIQAHFMTSSSKGGKRLAESYIALAGILETIEGKIRDTTTANIGTLSTQIAEENAKIAEQTDKLNILLAAKEKHKNSPGASGALGGGGYGDAQDRNIVTANNNIAASKEKIAENEKSIQNAHKNAQKQILKGSIEQLKVQMKIAELTGTSAFNTGIMADSLAGLEDLEKQLDSSKGLNNEEFLVGLELVRRYPNTIRDSFTQIDSLLATFNATMGKRNQKVKKEFQDEEEGAQAIIDKFEELTKVQKTGRTADKKILSPKAVEESKKLLDELNARIKGLRLNKEFGTGVKGLTAFKNYIVKTRVTLDTMEKSLIKARGQFVELSKAAKGIVGGQAFLDEEKNEILKQEITFLEKKYEIEQKASGQTEKDFALSTLALDLTNKITAAKSKQLKPEVIKAKLAVDELKTKKQALSLTKKRMQEEQKLLTIIARARASGGKLTPAEQFNLDVDTAKLKVATAKKDLDFTILKVKMERALLVAQMEAAEITVERQTSILKLLDAQNAIVKDTARQAVNAAQTGITSTIQEGIGTFDTGFDRMGSNGLGGEGFKMQMQAVENLTVATNTLAAAKENLKKKKEASDAAFAAAYDSSSSTIGTEEASDRAILAAQAAKDTVIQAQKDVKNAAMSMVTDTMTGLSKTLEQLGPEGKFAASFGNLGTIMMTSVVGALQVLDEQGGVTATSLAAGFSAAANVIGGIASILSAQANQQVAAVDQQIEAEKKRDGQSAASVAKMKAMEAKKDQIKRKAFETNKKMMIAQAIMSTAAGVAGAMAVGTLYEIPVGLIAAGIVGAMGAAQIAIISGMSYQGGGNAPSATKPSAVSLGSRNNTVDLARGNSAGGELAYMRGERGQGTGATNFKPGSAFTGAKYRASGGETAGFMVGEQGPELFIPDRSGRIAPADETAAMSNISNVNFNISAVDAAGVEDVLVRQKGHIIRMIREAANEHGQPFLESVSDGAYVE
jgi:hypothetical protein